jgi:hypothetical protein
MGHRDTTLPTLKALVTQIKRLAKRNSHDFAYAGEHNGLTGQVDYVIKEAYPNVSAELVKDNALMSEIAERLNQPLSKKTDFQQTTLDGAGFEPVIFAPPYFRDEQGNWQPRNKLSLSELRERSEIRVQKRHEALEIATAQHAAIEAAYDEVVRRGLDPDEVFCKPPPDMDDEDDAAEAQD